MLIKTVEHIFLPLNEYEKSIRRGTKIYCPVSALFEQGC